MTNEINKTNEMRVYVGTYGKYNSGSIAGAWLDLSDFSDRETFYQECAKLHCDETDPEYMFQDWEGVPSSLISEGWVSPVVFEIAQLNPDDILLIEAFEDCMGSSCVDWDDLDRLLESINYRYAGQYDSDREFTEHMIYDVAMAEVPSGIVIDVDATWNSYYRFDYSAGVDSDGYRHYFTSNY